MCILVGQVAAEQAEGVADAGATRNEAGYGGVRDGHISVGGVQCGPLPVAWRAWDGLLERAFPASAAATCALSASPDARSAASLRVDHLM